MISHTKKSKPPRKKVAKFPMKGTEIREKTHVAPWKGKLLCTSLAGIFFLVCIRWPRSSLYINLWRWQPSVDLGDEPWTQSIVAKPMISRTLFFFFFLERSQLNRDYRILLLHVDPLNYNGGYHSLPRMVFTERFLLPSRLKRYVTGNRQVEPV